ncbi:TPA: MotA/TolQ/ExbB proton channel family protein [Klebsiella michiganensis]|uniref:MotA/TolQ/ExbB proton channel family protein n=1 Tax=Enterobacter hormaechei TaxID=158836 RepID=UPI0039083A73
MNYAHSMLRIMTLRRSVLAAVFTGLAFLAIPAGVSATPVAEPASSALDTPAGQPKAGASIAADATPAIDATTQPAAGVSEPEIQAPVAPMPGAKVENPYGLKAMWEQGDMVSRGTLFILLIMSGASWYVLVTKLLEQRNLHRQSRNVQRDFWRLADEGDLDTACRDLHKSSEFRYLVRSGMVAQRQYAGTLTQQVDLNTWLSQSIGQAIDTVNDRLQGGLSVLATVGSTAPFIGLFGTVWGIYHALTAIGISGQASIDKVAGPVGESLIMTALGLAVAVPAVLGYNWLIRRNKTALDVVRTFGGELHTVMLGGKPATSLGD